MDYRPVDAEYLNRTTGFSIYKCYKALNNNFGNVLVAYNELTSSKRG